MGQASDLAPEHRDTFQPLLAHRRRIAVAATIHEVERRRGDGRHAAEGLRLRCKSVRNLGMAELRDRNRQQSKHQLHIATPTTPVQLIGHGDRLQVPRRSRDWATGAPGKRLRYSRWNSFFDVAVREFTKVESQNNIVIRHRMSDSGGKRLACFLWREAPANASPEHADEDYASDETEWEGEYREKQEDQSQHTGRIAGIVPRRCGKQEREAQDERRREGCCEDNRQHPAASKYPRAHHRHEKHRTKSAHCRGT